MGDDLRTSRIAVGAVTLHVTEAGPADGPPVVLLHGFPEPAALGWRSQIGPLAAAGFRVIAPDQRGYNLSDKPPRAVDYALDRLAGDVVGLLDALGLASARLVGHDWGGVVAWWLAAMRPDRVARLAILNAPHPIAFRHYLRSHPRQLLRSWYVFWFQLPRWPEFGLRSFRWRGLTRALVGTSRPGTFSAADLEAYRRAWSEPGAIRAMIHWYRAALRHPPRPPGDLRIGAPTLLLWGARDRFLSRDLAEASAAHCDHGRLELFEAATHWLQHEEADRVNARLVEFFG